MTENESKPDPDDEQSLEGELPECESPGSELCGGESECSDPGVPDPEVRDETRTWNEERSSVGLIDFQALVREGDSIIYDLVSGSMQFNDRTDWWGHFQVPRNSPAGQMPEVGRYYMLHLKDGRCGTMIIDRCLKNVNKRYPTIQFHGAGPLE